MEGGSVTPDLLEILKAVRDITAAGLRVSLPGRVTAVKPELGRVSVRPELRVARPGRDQGVSYQAMPELLDVPVVWPGTAAVELTFEVRPGDPGIVHFADFPLGAWLDAGALVSPVLPDAHGPGGAFFVPGLFPQDERPALPEAPLRVRMGLRGGARVEVADGEVRVLDGGSAVSLATKADVQDVRDALNGHEHTYGLASGVGVTITPTSTEGGPSVPAPAGTTILKGQ
jgi:hypothetical protein